MKIIFNYFLIFLFPFPLLPLFPSLLNMQLMHPLEESHLVLNSYHVRLPLHYAETFKNRKILLSYIMEITKISSKGQIVIPQKMRNELNITEGSVLAIEKMKDFVVIKKIDKDLVRQFEEGLEDLKLGRLRRVA